MPRSEWVIVKNAHPAIVDDDLWEAVEETKRRRNRFRANSLKKGGDKTAFSPYLLTGLLKCGHCGANYIAQSPRGEKPANTPTTGADIASEEEKAYALT